MSLPKTLSAGPNTGGENPVSLSELIELTNTIRATTADKISGIQRVTGML